MIVSFINSLSRAERIEIIVILLIIIGISLYRRGARRDYPMGRLK